MTVRCGDLRAPAAVEATLVVAAHAVASRAPEPILADPFAEVVVRGVGQQPFLRIVDGTTNFAEIGYGWCPPLFGIRARTFDEFLLAACRSGIRQAVLLGSGLDCRAYRLDWPTGMALYEVDQLTLMDWKPVFLANCGVTSTARHRCVGADLRQGWPSALCKAGFDESQPTAWIIEGLLPAPPSQILAPISALSRPGSCLTADYFEGAEPEVADDVADQLHGLDSSLGLHSVGSDLPRVDPAAYLAAHGWIGRSAHLVTAFAAIGRPVPAAIAGPQHGALLRILRATRLDTGGLRTATW